MTAHGQPGSDAIYSPAFSACAFPKTTTRPSRRSAAKSWPLAQILRILVPAKLGIVCAPPQMYVIPSEVSAIELLAPAAILTTVLVLSAGGMDFCADAPTTTTVPLARNRSVCSLPAAIMTTSVGIVVSVDDEVTDLSPQNTTVPVFLRAALKFCPTAT